MTPPMKRVRHRRGAFTCALLVLTLLAMVPAAFAAPISVRLEAELLTNPASEIFVCCSDPDQKVVNETVLVGSFSGGPAGSSASAHVDMTAGIIKHRSAGEQSFTTGTFTGRTRASTDISISDILTVHGPAGSTSTPFTFIMDYRSVLVTTSGLDLTRVSDTPPSADPAGASAQTSFFVRLLGPGVDILQTGLKGETVDTEPIADEFGVWTGFESETRFTFEEYAGIFDGAGASVAEPGTFEITIDVPLDTPLSFAASFQSAAECNKGTSCTSIADVGNSAAFLFTVPDGFTIASESGYGYLSRLTTGEPSSVPEPTGLLLLGSGLAGLLALSRRS